MPFLRSDSLRSSELRRYGGHHGRRRRQPIANRRMTLIRKTEEEQRRGVKRTGMKGGIRPKNRTAWSTKLHFKI